MHYNCHGTCKGELASSMLTALHANIPHRGRAEALRYFGRSNRGGSCGTGTIRRSLRIIVCWAGASGLWPPVGVPNIGGGVSMR